MIDPTLVRDEPPGRLPKAPSPRLRTAVADTVRARHRIVALTRRDFTARYKQTALGLSWAVLLPVLTITVFSVFVQRFARSDTHGAPYVLWSFLGLFAWNFFSNAVNNGGVSLLINQSLLNKVFTTRQIYPVAGVCLAALDTLVSLGVLAVAFAALRYVPGATIYWLPLPLLVLAVFTLAVTFMVSILIVYVRDLRNIIPIALQLGLFVTPVIFGLDRIAPGYRLLYCIANPIAPVIETTRRIVLYGQEPQWTYLAAGAASAVLALFVAFWVFTRFERGIVDII